MELLRILSMFMVLGVHANYLSLGFPTPSDINSAPLTVFIRDFFQVLCVPAVNCFILISGWFKIRPSLKGICNFLFQCLFFIVGTYIASCLFGLTSFSMGMLKTNLSLGGAYWFVGCYIGLYVLAPVLNSYIERASDRQLAIFLIFFYIYQTILGMTKQLPSLVGGYSVFSFIGLYVLAQYLRRKQNDKYLIGGITIFVGACLANTLLAFLFPNYISLFIYYYINPFIVLEAVGLLMIFASLRIKPNRVVNFVAASCFSVYLVHCSPAIMEGLYKPINRYIFDHYSGFACLGLILLFMSGVYIGCIAVDQLRKIIWKPIGKCLSQFQK